MCKTGFCKPWGFGRRGGDQGALCTAAIKAKMPKACAIHTRGAHTYIYAYIYIYIYIYGGDQGCLDALKPNDTRARGRGEDFVNYSLVGI